MTEEPKIKKFHSKNIELYQVSNEMVKGGLPDSVLSHALYIEKIQFQGNPLMDEVALWMEMNNNGLIEAKDIKECKRYIRNSTKYVLSSLILGFGFNRLGITKTRAFHWRTVIRIPLRLFFIVLPLGLSYYFPIMNEFSRLHYYFNVKYAERLKKYNQEGEPLIMNPTFMEDIPDAESRKSIYEKTKSYQMMKMMQSKEMEKRNLKM